MKLVEVIVKWIREEVKKSGREGAVLGLSGGLDSSVAACLTKKALGEKVIGLLMSCHNDPVDEDYAWKVAKKFNIKTRRVVLNSVYDSFLKVLPPGGKISRANLKPRLRMITLYYFANNLNYLVVGTGNKSELMVGYFTKYGDGGVDILPIGGLLKTQVKELAKDLGIPNEIIKRAPSAGLWEGQTDEEELGLTYEELDEAIEIIESGKKFSSKKVDRVRRLMKNSQHKRSLPLIFQK